MTRKRVLPDVHVALHFRRFDQLDWRALVGADEVVVLIAPPFISELDDKKTGSKGSLQRRARNFSSWLGDRFAEPEPRVIREGVTLVFLAEEPEASIDFEKHRLVPSNKDDRYIACILAERQRDPDTEIVFVTGDNLAKVKAHAKGIRFVEPPHDAKLADEPDPLEKELAETRKALARFVDATSELRLSFANGKDHAIERVELPILARSEAEADLRRAAHRHQMMRHTKAIAIAMTDPFKPQPKSRDAFLKEREEWIGARFRTALDHAMTIHVALALSNVGRAPATRIEVEIQLPEQVSARVRPLADLPGPPPMMAPSQFASLGDSALAKMDFDSLRVRSADPERLIIDPTSRQRVRFEVDALNHHGERVLPVVRLVFRAPDKVGNFKMSYRILSATQPDPAVGELHFKITRAEKRLDLPDHE